MPAENRPGSLAHTTQNKYCVSPEPAIYRINLTAVRLWDSSGSAQARENAAPRTLADALLLYTIRRDWSLFQVQPVTQRAKSVQHLENIKGSGVCPCAGAKLREVICCLRRPAAYLVQILFNGLMMLFCITVPEPKLKISHLGFLSPLNDFSCI